MQNIDLNQLKKVVCIGIGGGDLYYISKFLLYIGTSVLGFDICKSERTEELEKEGIDIQYRNPIEKFTNCDLVLYSDALADALLKEIKILNKDKKFVEVGHFKRYLITLLETDLLKTEHKKALEKAYVFPLYNTNWGEMKLIGVTGTDGKTTVVSMIHHMLLKLGYRPGMISTVGTSIGGKNTKLGYHVTTPSSQEIYRALAEMKKEKCTHAILECTSQGLFMGRLVGLKFDVVVYTNIQKEHLGYHKTWGNYAEAKSLLIKENLKDGGYAILNADDEEGFKYIENLTKKKVLYSIKSEKGVYAKDIRESFEGISFKISDKEFNIPILGKYNVSNALAGICALKVLGIKEVESTSTLSSFSPVEGRMNVLQKKPFFVIVDFAHTPNGLLNALKSVKELKSPQSKLILVFGCAAKRDEYKRPVMGRHSKEYADITILTAEDCRSESLVEINNQIEKGWSMYKSKEKRKLIRFDNDKENIKVRRDAIKKAISLAERNDIVLITGKGHERSLCFGIEEYPWNDIEEVKNILKQKN